MILVDNRNNTDPYINLAIEDFLVREADCAEEDLLLLYINSPCVVLGRNQCIYREVNFEYLRNRRLQLARRISGGGTVYHDAGNLNFSIVSRFAEHKINNYAYFNLPVVDALHRAGISARMDKRNNILYGEKKVSGSAQFTNRRNILSQGTLLFDADLDVLKACLKENDFKIETQAVKSVRSEVINLKKVSSTFADTNQLQQYIASELTHGEIYSFAEQDWQAIINEAGKKFHAFEWVYGRSPESKTIREGAEITVVDGVIRKIQLGGTEMPGLIGVKYEFNSIRQALEGHPGASELLAVIF